MLNHNRRPGPEKRGASPLPWLGQGLPELSPREFARFRQLVYRHAGIALTEQKRELVQGRLAKLLRERGLTSFQEYYELITGDGSGTELAGLLDAISTNQTAFWREPAHFQFLLEELLPSWRRERRGGLAWRFWSAGCSTGEEPYSLAMVLGETLAADQLKHCRILASDLNTRVLETARRGIYPAPRLAPLPSGWRRRYFLQGTGRWSGFLRVKPALQQLVSFFRHNLMDRPPFQGELDLILCRNVMIYFDKATQAELVDKFFRCLSPGGYLFIGHSESLCNLTHRFTYIRPAIYRK